MKKLMVNSGHKETLRFPAENQQKRKESAQYVTNSMRLEGVTLDQTVGNLEAYSHGEITEDEFIAHGLKIALAIEKGHNK